MSIALADALKQLDLQPGELRSVAVNGYKVEIRVLPAEGTSAAESMMLDLRLDIPSSPQAKTIIVSKSKPIFPSPFELQETDLAPE